MRRVLWWLVAEGRPRDWSDVLPVLTLFALAAAGAVAIGWPWLSVELQRQLTAAVTALSSGWTWFLTTLEHGLAALPRL